MRSVISLCLVVSCLLLGISGANAAGSNTGAGVSAAPSSGSPIAPQASTDAIVVTVPVPGTGAPAATLGGFTMTRVPSPGAPACTSDTSPIATPGGAMSIAPTDAPTVRCIGSGWASWSHGYAGDVYYTGGATSQTITMPPATRAFYFYVEPNPFSMQTCSATATSSTGTASTGGIAVDGSGGARYIGFHETTGTISSVAVTCTTDFATGEYGWATGTPPPVGIGGDVIGQVGVIGICQDAMTGETVADPDVPFGAAWQCPFAAGSRTGHPILNIVIGVAN